MQYNFSPRDIAVIQDHIDSVGTLVCIVTLEKASQQFSCALNAYLKLGNLRQSEFEKVSKAHAQLIVSLRAFSMFSNDHLLHTDIHALLSKMIDCYSDPDNVLK